MEKITLLHRFKNWIGSTGFKMLLWGYDLTADQYWNQIYQAEKKYLERKNSIPDF